MRLVKWTLAIVFLGACTSTPKSIESPLGRGKTNRPTEPIETSGSSIDYIGLQRSLGMEIPITRLGYKEKIFNTCEVGYGYSGTHDCHRQYMVVINFQLQCRDTEGQVSEGVHHSDVRPIADKSVRWNLKGIQGNTKTNFDGFGQVLAVSPMSQRQERIKLGVGNEFLYMRANEINRVVTPRPWCEQ